MHTTPVITRTLGEHAVDVATDVTTTRAILILIAIPIPSVLAYDVGESERRQPDLHTRAALVGQGIVKDAGDLFLAAAHVHVVGNKGHAAEVVTVDLRSADLPPALAIGVAPKPARLVRAHSI